MHPLEPYAYEVAYRGGRRLRWESPGGPWGERRLPVEDLEALTVLGHPRGVIRIRPRAIRTLGFCLRLRGTLEVPGGHRRRWCFGLLGADGLVHGVTISDRGEVTDYVGPSTAW